MRQKIDFINLSKEIRRKILAMVFNTQGSHIGCSLGVVEILIALYFEILNIDPKHPEKEERDRFVLSKGHACATLYSVLAKRGFFSEQLLEKYCINGSKIAAHSTLGSLPGIEATAGSLGHGLPMAAGMALAAKHKKLTSKIYVLTGDGECMEGSIWEAILFSSHYKLDNLILIIDNNDLITLGKISEITDLYPLDKKLESFGWATVTVNGHNINDIISALKTPHPDKPMAIVAKTVKGKGVSFMENNLEWHGKCPTKEQYELALNELI